MIKTQGVEDQDCINLVNIINEAVDYIQTGPNTFVERVPKF